MLFVISLFMGDVLVFVDASFETNEPMIYGLNEPELHECQWIHVLILD